MATMVGMVGMVGTMNEARFSSLLCACACSKRYLLDRETLFAPTRSMIEFMFCAAWGCRCR